MKYNNSKRRYKRNDFILDGSGTGVKVPDASPEALEGALRSFKKNLKEAGTLMEYKARQEYTKKTTIRRKQREDAERNQKIATKREIEYWDNMVWTIMTKNGAI